jgi:hypothetical protein
MGQLTFRCPGTGRAVASGVDTDDSTLRVVRPVTIRLTCPFCTQEHAWPIAEGFIDQPRVA